MDPDKFLQKELNINGKISNLIHHLSYAEIKRLIVKYARLWNNSDPDIQQPDIPGDNNENTGEPER